MYDTTIDITTFLIWIIRSAFVYKLPPSKIMFHYFHKFLQVCDFQE